MAEQNSATGGVRPHVRTGSLGGLDRMPGMLILELYRAQISERGHWQTNWTGLIGPTIEGPQAAS